MICDNQPGLSDGSGGIKDPDLARSSWSVPSSFFSIMYLDTTVHAIQPPLSAVKSRMSLFSTGILANIADVPRINISSDK